MPIFFWCSLPSNGLLLEQIKNLKLVCENGQKYLLNLVRHQLKLNSLYIIDANIIENNWIQKEKLLAKLKEK